MNEQERTIFDLAEPYLKTRDIDVIHTKIAVQFGFKLLRGLYAERSIVIPALILHDVGYSQLPDNIIEQWRKDPFNQELQKIHEREGSKLARSILQKIQYDPELTDRICDIIACHDTGGATSMLEEQIVRDCDKVWRYTEIAFKRDLVLFHKTAQEFYDALENGLGKWFSLPLSRQIAQRHLEILKGKLSTF